MSTSETLFQQLKAMPNLALLIERINEELKNEAKQREEFYDLVHEKINAEFINGKVVMQRIVENGIIRSTVVTGFEVEISDLFR